MGIPVVATDIGGLRQTMIDGKTGFLVPLDDVVSQTAANIRAVREPDAYQGKGIKYKEEQLKLKPGKQAAKAA
jgi:large subunit ribosomal protein L6